MVAIATRQQGKEGKKTVCNTFSTPAALLSCSCSCEMCFFVSWISFSSLGPGFLLYSSTFALTQINHNKAPYKSNRTKLKKTKESITTQESLHKYCVNYNHQFKDRLCLIYTPVTPGPAWLASFAGSQPPGCEWFCSHPKKEETQETLRKNYKTM